MDPTTEDRVTTCPSRTTALRESFARMRRRRRSDQPPITVPGKRRLFWTGPNDVDGIARWRRFLTGPLGVGRGGGAAWRPWTVGIRIRSADLVLRILSLKFPLEPAYIVLPKPQEARAALEIGFLGDHDLFDLELELAQRINVVLNFPLDPTVQRPLQLSYLLRERRLLSRRNSPTLVDVTFYLQKLLACLSKPLLVVALVQLNPIQHSSRGWDQLIARRPRSTNENGRPDGGQEAQAARSAIFTDDSASGGLGRGHRGCPEGVAPAVVPTCRRRIHRKNNGVEVRRAVGACNLTRKCHLFSAKGGIDDGKVLK
jgi:hypothetical protein